MLRRRRSAYASGMGDLRQMPSGLHGRWPTGTGLVGAVAAGRLAIGMTALAVPRAPLRWWVDDEDVDRTGTRLLARALGGRDVALALGALAALAGDGDPRPWALAGVVADGGDVLATALAWRRLPRWRRRLVASLAGCAAVMGALAVTLDQRDHRDQRH